MTDPVSDFEKLKLTDVDCMVRRTRPVVARVILAILFVQFAAMPLIGLLLQRPVVNMPTPVTVLLCAKVLIYAIGRTAEKFRGVA